MPLLARALHCAKEFLRGPCAACGNSRNAPLCSGCRQRSLIGPGVRCGISERETYSFLGAYYPEDRKADPPLSPLGRATVAFKDRGDRYAGRCLARLFRERFAPLLPGCDAVVPVPVDRAHLRARGFGPVLWLARALATGLGKPLFANALVRDPTRPAQRGLDGFDRRRNAEGLFTLGPHDLRGYAVALVDDVVTTGATLHDAADCLRAADVTVLACTVLACADREVLAACRSKTENAGNNATSARKH